MISNEDRHDDGPLPTIDEVLACQFSSWYETFAKLPPNALKRTTATVKSSIIDLPWTFHDYLSTDGVQLPRGAKTSGFLADIDNESGGWSSDDDDHTTRTSLSHKYTEFFEFPELDRRIEAEIQALGGAVIPKLNWSAPKDAIWVNAGTLLCKTPGDIYLLLKSSDFCAYDLQHACSDVRGDSSKTPPLQLVLRKWCNFYPSQEFRCFVRSHELLAISQRHHSQHFPHLNTDKFLMQSLITEFFDEVIRNQFAQGSIANYVFDVYVDKNERVWLIDFNVWGRRTDPLLYDWSELMELDTDIPEIRVVQVEKEVRTDPLASYRAPIDTIHIASMTGGDKEKFREFMSMCERPTVLEDDI